MTALRASIRAEMKEARGILGKGQETKSLHPLVCDKVDAALSLK